MKLHLFAAIVAAGIATHAAAAEPWTLGVHTLSAHFPAQDYQNNTNLGAYLRSPDGWVVGAYRNTVHRDTVYVGHEWHTEDGWGVALALGTGYQRHAVYSYTECPKGTVIPAPYTTCSYRVSRTEGYSRGAIAPLLDFSYAFRSVWGISPRVNFMPPLPKCSAVVHLSLERAL